MSRHRYMHSPGCMRALVLLCLLAAMVSGCREHGAQGDTGVLDAGDAAAPQDVEVIPDARIDAALPDAEVDAAPNPNVIELPPNGHTRIRAFTNGGLVATYSDERVSPDMGQDVYYFDVLQGSGVRAIWTRAGSCMHGRS